MIRHVEIGLIYYDTLEGKGREGKGAISGCEQKDWNDMIRMALGILREIWALDYELWVYESW